MLWSAEVGGGLNRRLLCFLPGLLPPWGFAKRRAVLPADCHPLHQVVSHLLEDLWIRPVLLHLGSWELLRSFFQLWRLPEGGSSGGGVGEGSCMRPAWPLFSFQASQYFWVSDFHTLLGHKRAADSTFTHHREYLVCSCKNFFTLSSQGCRVSLLICAAQWWESRQEIGSQLSLHAEFPPLLEQLS